MKTLLILGAIEAFCDIIEEAKKMGIKTVVCDYFPDAPGKKNADFSYDISTTDIDEVEKIAKKHSVDGIMCAFSDRNIPTCYELSKRLGLPTYYTKEAIDIVTDKINMKDHFKKHGFPILNYKIINREFSDNEISHFDFPVVIKPIDASGSKGVIVCNTVEDVRASFEESAKHSANHKDEVIVEEYYPVDEISITAWVKNGKSYVTNIYDVIKNFGKNVVLSGVAFPSKYSKGNIEKFKKLVQELTDSLEIKEGPVTVQCFIGERGLKVSEYIFRLTGVSTYKYTLHLGGPNFARMVIDYAVGNSIDYQNLETFSFVEKNTVFQYRVYAVKPGKIFFDFTEDSIKKAIPECSYCKIYSQSGVEFSSVPTGGKVVAVVYCDVTDPLNEDTSLEHFVDALREHAVIYNENGEKVSNVNKPDKKVTWYCHDLKI